MRAVRNNFNYFLGSNASRLFNSLASKKLLPAQVDAYISKYKDPLVQEFFDRNIKILMSLISDNISVLDIGCGTGRYLAYIQSNAGDVRLAGVDISLNTINDYTKTLKNIDLRIGDFSELNPFEGRAFDLIYSITVLEYIPFFRVKNFLKIINAALTHNGILYLQFPHASSRLDLYANFQYTRYPVKKIESLLTNSGFIIHESKPLNPEKEFDLGYYIICKKK